MRTSIAVLGGLLMFACGGGAGETSGAATETTGASESDTTTPTTTPTTTGEPSGCDCFVVVDRQVKVLCPQPATCAVLDGECLDDETHCVPASAAALDCVLAAIRTDTTGEVSWFTKVTFSDKEKFSTINRTTRVVNLGAGQVFWTDELYTGLSIETGGVRRFELASLDLDECAAIVDAPARFDCLRGAFDTPPTEVCIEAMMF